jgi:hypothetical protein
VKLGSASLRCATFKSLGCVVLLTSGGITNSGGIQNRGRMTNSSGITNSRGITNSGGNTNSVESQIVE